MVCTSVLVLIFLENLGGVKRPTQFFVENKKAAPAVTQERRKREYTYTRTRTIKAVQRRAEGLKIGRKIPAKNILKKGLDKIGRPMITYSQARGTADSKSYRGGRADAVNDYADHQENEFSVCRKTQKPPLCQVTVS